MTVKKLIDEFVSGKLSFAEAKKKLKEMGRHMDLDDYEKVDLCLETLREIKEVDRGQGSDPMDHQFKPLEAIPNELYLEIFFFCVQKIADGVYPHNVGNMMYDEFGIGSQLATFFYNEALDMVRLNNLTPDQIQSIGEEYMKAKMSEMIADGTMKVLRPPPIQREKISDGNDR